MLRMSITGSLSGKYLGECDQLFSTFPNKLCFRLNLSITQPFCCAASKYTYDLTPFSIHLIFPPLPPKSMTRRQSLACWGLSYSNMRLFTSPPVPFSFSQWGGRAYAFSCLIRFRIEQSILSQVQVYKGIHTLASLHPCRTNTLFPKKWHLPLLQMESSESSVRYILQSIRLILIIQATYKCSFDRLSSCHSSVVSPTTVSETTLATESYHDAFLICMSYSTGAGFMLTY